MHSTELFKIVAQVRDTLEQVIYESHYVDIELQGFPSGACEVSSVILGLFLQSHFSLDVKKCLGVRKKHNDYRNESHVWLVIENKVITDITADQFQGFSERAFVGEASEFHSTFQVCDVSPVDINDLRRQGSQGYLKIYDDVVEKLRFYEL